LNPDRKMDVSQLGGRLVKVKQFLTILE